MLDLGATMARDYGTTDSARKIVKNTLDNSPVFLQIQREIVD